MICTVHDEFDSGCYLAEFSDNQLVFQPIVMMCDMPFEIRISYIGKITDNYVRISYRRLDINFSVVSGNRLNSIWIRSFFIVHGNPKDVSDE